MTGQCSVPAARTVVLFLAVISMTWYTACDCALRNSSLACTRGQRQTRHQIKCSRTGGEEDSGIILINRIFYGTPPLTSGCSRTAPYEHCCVRDDSEVDCLFTDDYELLKFSRFCSSASTCTPSGRRLNSEKGSCNQTIYPSLTSFSFVEYECVDTTKFRNFCSDVSVFSSGGEIFLDSNHVISNDKLSDSECSCIVVSECGAEMTFTALDVWLKSENGSCVEELFFTDAHNSSVKEQYTCRDPDESIHDQVIFTSHSNAVNLRMNVTGEHIGNVFIRVTTPHPASGIQLLCGTAKSFYQPTSSGCSDFAQVPATIATFTDNQQYTTTPAGAGETSTESQDGMDEEPNTLPVTSSSDELHPGAIAGITLAIIAIILVIVLIIILVLGRRKRNSGDEREMEHPVYFNMGLDTPSVSNFDDNSDADGYATVSEVVSEMEESSVGKSGKAEPSSFAFENPNCVEYEMYGAVGIDGEGGSKYSDKKTP
ncbi:uncharacterized protein LOC101861304 [Aplysia californica]|uniref:Uncharacterized protein LOC101861304 n=1 Tax=Aplysia californica TaxID=6500 RepID=A0ABM0JYU0_APLCA|nr:uncharacterized protein LOC101861304 [Aplysia californica]XP_005104742.1 uncharacterized protein LOC101861304 [Aplysia californica]